MSKKLTRAEIPMCPECGGEMVWCDASSFYGCDPCADNPAGGKAWTNHPDYGHYPIDVAAVVKKMEEHVRYCVGQSRSPTCRELRGFIHQLEGLK